MKRLKPLYTAENEEQAKVELDTLREPALVLDPCGRRAKEPAPADAAPLEW